MAKITATQQAFIDALFGPANGKLSEAAKIATGREDYNSLMDDNLLDAVKKRADTELTLRVPKALYIMNRALDEPENMIFLEKVHKIAADILDRAGVSKQERSQNSNAMIGIVMLPLKAELPAPPENPQLTIDASFKEVV